MHESDGRRRRLRGMMNNKGVQRSGWMLLATSVISAVTYDMKQPDSIIRGLVQRGRQKLLDYRRSKELTENISDRVTILDGEPDGNAHM